MDRKEAARQIKSRWVSRRLAAMALGFDLLKEVEPFTSPMFAAISTKTVGKEKLLNWQEVLELSKFKTGRQFLDRHWPPKRRSSPMHRLRLRQHKSATAKVQFSRNLRVLERHAHKFDYRVPGGSDALVLLYRLIELARTFRRFDLNVSLKYVANMTALRQDRELVRARRQLREAGVLHESANEDGLFVLTLRNPKSRQFFPDLKAQEFKPAATDEEFAHTSWDGVTF